MKIHPMPDLLFLTQRIPYPPTKGEKIRALQILRFLRERYTVHLGCLIDDPSDWAHVPALKELCGETYFAPLNPRVAKITCLRGLANGAPLSVLYFYNRGLDAWVADLLARRHPDAAVVCSSAMAQYLMARPNRPRKIIMDFVDVDADKWRQYAERHVGPMRWVYGRESRKLLAFDRKVAQHFDASTFVSAAEAALFRQLAPEIGTKAHFVNSGVDSAYFTPAQVYANPYPDGAPVAVFTGTMDYWPNVDAVTWFATDILPRARQSVPDLRFAIVGSSPDPKVQELSRLPGVLVTGRVPDVRPYFAHASLAVVPLRVAGGVQNKVLEAMAMAKVVVASPRALAGLDAEAARHVVIADTADGFVRAIVDTVAGRVAPDFGTRARQCVLDVYDWATNLTGFLPYLGLEP
jgi:sugar transferase (PEP-CTERM/EpsH1 system associated)